MGRTGQWWCGIVAARNKFHRVGRTRSFTAGLRACLALNVCARARPPVSRGLMEPPPRLQQIRAAFGLSS